MAQYGKDTPFVVYCAGPHCNGANKGAIRLARLGYRVKEMWRHRRLARRDFALEQDRRSTQAA